MIKSRTYIDLFLTSFCCIAEAVGTLEVSQGEEARLPCDVTTLVPGVRFDLVLWFRNESLKPFFT
jgi:hypothetical protein